MLSSGSKDWQWLYECVPDKLKELHKNGYRVVFFTNQLGIEKLKVKPEELQRKIEDMIEQIGVPIFVSFDDNLIMQIYGIFAMFMPLA